jgi:hypothetical protein
MFYFVEATLRHRRNMLVVRFFGTSAISCMTAISRISVIHSESTINLASFIKQSTARYLFGSSSEDDGSSKKTTVRERMRLLKFSMQLVLESHTGKHVLWIWRSNVSEQCYVPGDRPPSTSLLISSDKHHIELKVLVFFTSNFRERLPFPLSEPHFLKRTIHRCYGVCLNAQTKKCIQFSGARSARHQFKSVLFRLMVQVQTELLASGVLHEHAWIAVSQSFCRLPQMFEVDLLLGRNVLRIWLGITKLPSIIEALVCHHETLRVTCDSSKLFLAKFSESNQVIFPSRFLSSHIDNIQKVDHTAISPFDPPFRFCGLQCSRKIRRRIDTE